MCKRYTQVEGGNNSGRLYVFSGKCANCGDAGCDPIYDARISKGPYKGSWGLICHKCFTEIGSGLGVGLGQKYELTGDNK